MKEFEFTVVATVRVRIEVEDNQTGFDALAKARHGLIGKNLKLRDWDDEENPHQTRFESFGMKIENVIVGDLAPYFTGE